MKDTIYRFPAPKVKKWLKESPANLVLLARSYPTIWIKLVKLWCLHCTCMVLSFQSPFTCMNRNDQWAFFLLLGKRVYKVKWLTQVQEPESRSLKNTAMVFATSCVDCFYLPSYVHLVLCTELLICSFFNSNGSKGWQNYSAKIQNFLAMIFKQKF